MMFTEYGWHKSIDIEANHIFPGIQKSVAHVSRQIHNFTSLVN
jgi:hypothetical protein